MLGLLSWTLVVILCSHKVKIKKGQYIYCYIGLYWFIFAVCLINGIKIYKRKLRYYFGKKKVSSKEDLMTPILFNFNILAF